MIIARRWRTRKSMLALLLLEFPITVAALTLFALAQPDTYRQLLWQDGSDNGFNSSPDEILYSYANHDRSQLKVPLVWSQTITEYNVVISVLSTFILMVKAVMFVMGTFVPLLSVLTHVAEVAIYAASIYGQAGPDMSDPKHPQPGAPWYITKSCSVVYTKSNYGYCQQAKACFAVTIIMLAMFVAYLGLAIFSSIPTQQEKASRQSNLKHSNIPEYEPETATRAPWHKQGSEVYLAPLDPARTPYTPRAVGFQTIDGAKARSPGSLPFREKYGGESH